MSVPNDLDSGTGEERVASRPGSAPSFGSVGLVMGGVSLYAVVVAALYGWSSHAAIADFYGVPGSAIYQDWGSAVFPALLICLAGAVAALVLALVFTVIGRRRGAGSMAASNTVAVGIWVGLLVLSLAVAWFGGSWWTRHQQRHDTVLKVLSNQQLCPPAPAGGGKLDCILVSTHGPTLFTRWIDVETGQLGSDLKQVSASGYDTTATRFPVVLPVKN